MPSHACDITSFRSDVVTCRKRGKNLSIQKKTINIQRTLDYSHRHSYVVCVCQSPFAVLGLGLCVRGYSVVATVHTAWSTQ